MRCSAVTPRLIATIAIALSTLTTAAGAETHHPRIPSAGRTFHDFIPSGWHLLTSEADGDIMASGDLNRDGRADLALVIESDRIVAEDRNIAWEMPDTARARILIVLFRQPGVAQRYRLAARHDTFIPRENEGGRWDPIQMLEISRGRLIIPVMSLDGCVGHKNYIFRYRNGEFMLIGADVGYVLRASQDFRERSFNFLTGRMTTEVGNGSTGKSRITWGRIPRKARGKLRTLRSFTLPFQWEIMEEVHL